MQRKIVKSVKKTGITPDFVYNLRVAQNHNYFANSILLHNCDDLNAPSNNSEAQLERALEFFTSTLPSRFNDLKTGRLVNCQQRLDERDNEGEFALVVRDATVSGSFGRHAPDVVDGFDPGDD
jgi:hypothetical protein